MSCLLYTFCSVDGGLIIVSHVSGQFYHMMIKRFFISIPAVVQWVRAFGWHAKVGCMNPRCYRPKSLKQVLTVPLSNARQQVCLDDHNKGRPVSHRCGTLKNPHCSMVTSPEYTSNLELFISNGDVFK